MEPGREPAPPARAPRRRTDRLLHQAVAPPRVGDLPISTIPDSAEQQQMQRQGNNAGRQQLGGRTRTGDYSEGCGLIGIEKSVQSGQIPARRPRRGLYLHGDEPPAGFNDKIHFASVGSAPVSYRGSILCKSTMPWTIINQDRIVNAAVLRPGGLSRRILEDNQHPIQQKHHPTDDTGCYHQARNRFSPEVCSAGAVVVRYANFV